MFKDEEITIKKIFFKLHCKVVRDFKKSAVGTMLHRLVSVSCSFQHSQNSGTSYALL